MKLASTVAAALMMLVCDRATTASAGFSCGPTCFMLSREGAQAWQWLSGYSDEQLSSLEGGADGFTEHVAWSQCYHRIVYDCQWWAFRSRPSTSLADIVSEAEQEKYEATKVNCAALVTTLGLFSNLNGNKVTRAMEKNPKVQEARTCLRELVPLPVAPGYTTTMVTDSTAAEMETETAEKAVHSTLHPKAAKCRDTRRKFCNRRLVAHRLASEKRAARLCKRTSYQNKCRMSCGLCERE